MFCRFQAEFILNAFSSRCVFLEHVPKDRMNIPSPPRSPKEKWLARERGVLVQWMPGAFGCPFARPSHHLAARPTTSHFTTWLSFSTVPNDSIGTPCYFPNETNVRTQ
eukprot:EG_transcript_7554